MFDINAHKFFIDFEILNSILNNFYKIAFKMDKRKWTPMLMLVESIFPNGAIILPLEADSAKAFVRK